MPRPPIPCEPDLLSRVTVRLLEDHKRERFEILVKERLYLQSAILVGQHLRYVYRTYEDTCSRFATRQLRALGGFPDEDGELRVPSDSTFRRLLMKLDPGAFAAIVGQLLMEQEVSAIGRLSVDGKVLRGSGRRDGRPLQLLSAVAHHLRLSLGQVPIDAKIKEIPDLQPLLESLVLPPGVLITADALHCQQKRARFITQELGGPCLLGLKGNQDGAEKKAEALVFQRIFPLRGQCAVGEAP